MKRGWFCLGVATLFTCSWASAASRVLSCGDVSVYVELVGGEDPVIYGAVKDGRLIGDARLGVFPQGSDTVYLNEAINITTLESDSADLPDDSVRAVVQLKGEDPEDVVCRKHHSLQL